MTTILDVLDLLARAPAEVRAEFDEWCAARTHSVMAATGVKLAPNFANETARAIEAHYQAGLLRSPGDGDKAAHAEIRRQHKKLKELLAKAGGEV